MDQIHTHMRPLLMMLGDYRSLTLNVVNRLTSVTRLFPNSFNDKFCDQMMVSTGRSRAPPPPSQFARVSWSLNDVCSCFPATLAEVDGGGGAHTQGRSARRRQCKYELVSSAAVTSRSRRTPMCGAVTRERQRGGPEVSGTRPGSERFVQIQGASGRITIDHSFGAGFLPQPPRSSW